MSRTSAQDGPNGLATRRLFLQSIPAVALFAPMGLPSAAAAETAEPRLERFIYDSRFSDAVDLARVFQDAGALLRPMSGDLTDLWRDDLRTAWRTAPMTLAGVTTPAGLFVLETLAGDHRMRVTHRQDLAPVGSRSEPLVFWTIAPRPRTASIA